MNVVRAKITTTIEEALLNQAKVLAKQEGLSGANAIIERALELYFTSIQCEVWEKSWFSKGILFCTKTSSAEKPWRTAGRMITHLKA